MHTAAIALTNGVTHRFQTDLSVIQLFNCVNTGQTINYFDEEAGEEVENLFIPTQVVNITTRTPVSKIEVVEEDYDILIEGSDGQIFGNKITVV